MSHADVTFERLVALAEGLLSPGERTALLSRMTVSDHAKLAWIERVLFLMRNDSTEDAPPEALARALRLFEPHTVPPIKTQIRAVLRFDSWRQPAPLGVRASANIGRQYIFNAGAHDIDLRVNPSGDQWLIAGQVLGQVEDGVVTLEHPQHHAHVSLSPWAEFTLPPVPVGVYTLFVAIGNKEIEIAGLDVGT
jgi:hypothetical protein